MGIHIGDSELDFMLTTKSLYEFFNIDKGWFDSQVQSGCIYPDKENRGGRGRNSWWTKRNLYALCFWDALICWGMGPWEAGYHYKWLNRKLKEKIADEINDIWIIGIPSPFHTFPREREKKYSKRKLNSFIGELRDRVLILPPKPVGNFIIMKNERIDKYFFGNEEMLIQDMFLLIDFGNIVEPVNMAVNRLCKF